MQYGEPRKFKTYKIHLQIMRHCYDEESVKYHRFGAKGITVGHYWRDFDQFYAYFGDAPDGTRFLRVDRKESYIRGNCGFRFLNEPFADFCDRIIQEAWEWRERQKRRAAREMRESESK